MYMLIKYQGAEASPINSDLPDNLNGNITPDVLPHTYTLLLTAIMHSMIKSRVYCGVGLNIYILSGRVNDVDFLHQLKLPHPFSAQG